MLECPSLSGEYIARSGSCITVDILGPDGAKKISTYFGHRAGVYNRIWHTVTSFAWVQNNTLVVSASSDQSIHIWDPMRGGGPILTLADPLILSSCYGIVRVHCDDRGVIVAYDGDVQVQQWEPVFQGYGRVGYRAVVQED